MQEMTITMLHEMLLSRQTATRWLLPQRSLDEEAMLQREDEADLITIRGGDNEAFSRIIARHQAHVARMMWRFCREPDQQRELVQDVFVQAWQSLESYSGRAPLRHWISRIATRCGYSYWRGLEKGRRRQADAVPLERLSTANMNDNEAEYLQTMLSRLPAGDRLVLVLRYLEGYSVRETATLTGWNPAVVKVRTFRARRRLAALLAAHGYTND